MAFKRKYPEYQVQKALSKYCLLQYPDTIFHSDYAGSNLSIAQASKMKSLQKPGISYPDWFLAEPAHGYHGLYIEIKAPGRRIRKRNGDWASGHLLDQARTIYRLREKGYYADFGVGVDECIAILDDYMNDNGFRISNA